DGRMGVFLDLIAGDGIWPDTCLAQQSIQQCSGARCCLAVDEAHFSSGQCRESIDSQRIAWGHHQALMTRNEPDDAVTAWLEQDLIGTNDLWPHGALGEMETCQVAGAAIERCQCFPRAAVLQVQAQFLKISGQQLNSKAMAGMESQDGLNTFK